MENYLAVVGNSNKMCIIWKLYFSTHWQHMLMSAGSCLDCELSARVWIRKCIFFVTNYQSLGDKKLMTRIWSNWRIKPCTDHYNFVRFHLLVHTLDCLYPGLWWLKICTSPAVLVQKIAHLKNNLNFKSVVDNYISD